LQTTTSVDSLSPSSPVFAALEECPIPSDVALNNIVGVLNSAEKRLIAPKKTDGVVEFSSSHRDDVESEKIVSESHSYVHTHPAAILDVKEILLRHRDKTREEIAQGSDALPNAPTSSANRVISNVPNVSNGFGSSADLPPAPDASNAANNSEKSAQVSPASPRPPVISNEEPAKDETLKGLKPPYVFPE